MSGSGSREPGSQAPSLKAERERLRLALAGGSGVRQIVNALSDAVDAQVVGAWEGLDPPAPVALVAVGGYGRREQCPASDVDLMVLHAGQSQPGEARVEATAKALFYQLWDAGLVVGHSVRTIKQALQAAREDFAAETSFLSSRLVTGDRELFDQFSRQALDQSKGSPEAFVERARRATLARRAQPGDATAELEPNLKEGRGGLRDLETINWLSTVCGPLDLPVDAGSLQNAADFLLTMRCALHFVTGRHTDVLLMQLQTQVLELIKGPGAQIPPDGFDSEDFLMRRLYRGSRQIAFALDRLLDPAYRQAAQQVPAELIQGVWTSETLAAFIGILGAGTRGWPHFRLLEQSGGLLKAIPEWESIWCLPQRNVYHRHAVDVHCFETAATMAGFFAASDAGDASNEPQPGRRGLLKRPRKLPVSPPGTAPEPEALAVKVAGDCPKHRDRLLLAALVHDIGKGTHQDHSVRGVQLARAALGRMGVDLLEKEDVAWLVRNHLLLTKTAVRRNIEDEALVVELAEAVGSTERLRMLYLLSAADGLATGPSAWTGWTSTLVGDLFTRIHNVLDRGELVNATASRTAHTRESELRTALSEMDQTLVDAHLTDMPRMWLLTQSLPALVQQSRLMIPPPEPQDLRLQAQPLDQPDHWEVTVVARGRPGLFSKVSGALALHGLNVLSAQVFTRQDGAALEVFCICGADGRFERVRRDILKALRGKISLDLRLAQKRSDYAGRISKGKQQGPQVRIDNTASDFYTVIEVHAADRVGLLYDITRALTELELDIWLAKVATYAHDVVDVFYVWDLEGQKVTDAEHLQEMERLILHRLSQD